MMKTAENFLCWKCGAALAGVPLPLSRLAECPACHAYAHVCRMCLHFDRNAPKQCREQDAEEVKDKERPNFCDYFKPNAKAYLGRDAKTQATKSKLDSLFGTNVAETPDKADDSRGKLDELFNKSDK